MPRSVLHHLHEFCSAAGTLTLLQASTEGCGRAVWLITCLSPGLPQFPQLCLQDCGAVMVAQVQCLVAKTQWICLTLVFEQAVCAELLGATLQSTGSSEGTVGLGWWLDLIFLP